MGVCVIVCMGVFVYGCMCYTCVCLGVFVYGCMCMGTNPDTHVIKTMATRFKTVAIVMISLFEKMVFNAQFVNYLLIDLD